MTTANPNTGKKKRGDITIMLLGSSERLTFRKKVKRELLLLGFKDVIIMEELQQDSKNLDYGSLDNKFEWIVTNYNPQLFFAIFHKKAKNINGVIFEIGWLCGKLRRNILHKKLRFMFEEGYDLKKEKTTAYIPALFNNILQSNFNESIKYEKCSEIIRMILVPMINK